MPHEREEPPYGAKAIANFFLEKDPGLTQMKLHKLLYYAHGWHLGFRKQPLLDEMVEAWEYGPVVPSIYHEFKDVGATGINRLATAFDPHSMAYDFIPTVNPADRTTLALLERVWEVYKKFSAPQLSRMTHAENSPWKQTRKKNPGLKGVDIPNNLIQMHFEDRLKED